MLRRIVVILGSLLILGAVPTASEAHDVSTGTKISKSKLPRGGLRAGQRVIIFGRVAAIDAACYAGVTVNLNRRVPGADRILQTDITDPEGEYFFLRRPRGDQRLYTSFLGFDKVFTDSTGTHHHTCGGSASPEFRLNVVK
jgi:hypothetical protein